MMRRTRGVAQGGWVPSGISRHTHTRSDVWTAVGKDPYAVQVADSFVRGEVKERNSPLRGVLSCITNIF